MRSRPNPDRFVQDASSGFAAAQRVGDAAKISASGVRDAIPSTPTPARAHVPREHCGGATALEARYMIAVCAGVRTRDRVILDFSAVG